MQFFQGVHNEDIQAVSIDFVGCCGRSLDIAQSIYVFVKIEH